MSWGQDVAFSYGHVQAETPAGRPGGDAERAAGDSGLVTRAADGHVGSTEPRFRASSGEGGSPRTAHS